MNSPRTYNRLESHLQCIIRSNITLPEDEIKEANRNLKNVLLGCMEAEMKQDETFRALYKEPQYTGSYFENLRVGHPDEFDINLVLELPIREENIHIDTEGTQPGFTRIKIERIFKPTTPEAVSRRIERWLENDYLSRPKVINWLQSVVDRALLRVSWPPNMTVESGDIQIRRKISGPAVTLLVTMGRWNFDVDLVPVFRFGRDKWPSHPLRQPNNLPRSSNTDMKWCVVPKAPRDATSDHYQWRMSFYMIEKGLMRDLNNMKPVIKLFKLLRDKQEWYGLSSYYIKTLFMWEQEYNKTEVDFWKKGLGQLFMHMLNQLEECLIQKRIRFFWHEDSNLLGHLDPSCIENMAGRANHLRRQLERALADPESNLRLVVEQVFTTPSKRSSQSWSPSPHEFSSLPWSSSRPQSSSPPPSRESLQQTSSVGWGALAAGVAAVGLAAVMAFSAVRNNNNRN